MSTDRIKKFDHNTYEKLKSYVYRLIDPRDGETFYVGMACAQSMYQKQS